MMLLGNSRMGTWKTDNNNNNNNNMGIRMGNSNRVTNRKRMESTTQMIDEKKRRAQ